VRDFLKTSHQGRQIVILRKNDSIETALGVLHKHNILSAPVVDHHFKILGYIDVLDIAGYVIREWRKASPTMEKHPLPNLGGTSIEGILAPGGAFAVPGVDANNTLSGAIQTFVDPLGACRFHRLAVSDNGPVCDVMSQSDIVSFAAANLGALGALGNASISELSMGRPPITVLSTESVADAIETLVSTRISGLAIVNPAGHLIGNLSASDLRLLKTWPDPWQYFSCSVWDFKKRGLSPGWGGVVGTPYVELNPKPVVACLKTNTFAEVVGLLSKAKVHRLYVTDEDNKPVCVISLWDVVKTLADSLGIEGLPFQ
jgi:CBS domain-containing protein